MSCFFFFYFLISSFVVSISTFLIFRYEDFFGSKKKNDQKRKPKFIDASDDSNSDEDIDDKAFENQVVDCIGHIYVFLQYYIHLFDNGQISCGGHMID